MGKESSGFLGTIKDKAKGLALALNIARLGGPVIGSEAAHELSEKIGMVEKKKPVESPLSEKSKAAENENKILMYRMKREDDEKKMTELREKIAHLYDKGEVGGGKDA